MREIVHGDLKGNSIVVTDNGSENGTAILTDFGLSFAESGSCSVKRRKGALSAMAWRVACSKVRRYDCGDADAQVRRALA
jgi:hypothetical protein